jgi:hypothetical protein
MDAIIQSEMDSDGQSVNWHPRIGNTVPRTSPAERTGDVRSERRLLLIRPE